MVSICMRIFPVSTALSWWSSFLIMCPWRCMKKEFMLMSLLIPKLRSPGDSIDAYLRLLIDELIELWTNGIRTYDRLTRRMCTLRVVVMWTIYDFPTYGTLSGWSPKGYMTMPNMWRGSSSFWHTEKVCYLGHRKWLLWDHE